MEAEKMENRLPDEQIQFAYNENLLKEASSIKDERRILKERLEKLEHTKESVSPAVYMRVYTDYSGKLDQSTQRLMALKRDLDKEERSLAEKKMIIEKQAKLHKESMEENHLRHTLEEISQEKMEDLNQVHTEEISRLERALHLLNDALARHRDIFAGEITPAISKHQAPTPPPAPVPERKISTPPTLRDVSTPAVEIPLPPKKVFEEESDISSNHTARINLNEQGALKEEPKPIEAATVIPADLFVYENGNMVQKLSLNKKVVIGRSPANEVVLKEAKVSRRHAEIQNIGGKYILMDLESSNGTFVGGKKISEYCLQPNDEIMIGATKMVFKLVS